MRCFGPNRKTSKYMEKLDNNALKFAFCNFGVEGEK